MASVRCAFFIRPRVVREERRVVEVGRVVEPGLVPIIPCQEEQPSSDPRWFWVVGFSRLELKVGGVGFSTM